MNRRMNQKAVTGTAAPSDAFKSARSGPPIRDLFISHVSKEVKSEDLNCYITEKGFTVVDVKCVSHKDAKNRSFQLSFVNSLRAVSGQKVLVSVGIVFFKTQ